MALVAYESSSSSSSSSDRDETQDAADAHPRPSRKRRRVHAAAEPAKASLPGLPAAFHNLYATGVRTSTSDDSALHGGRKRQVPHVEGRWPSHVSIEWHPSAAENAVLARLITECEEDTGIKAHSLLQSDLGVPLPLHISLSAPLSLETESRSDFLSNLTARVRKECGRGAFNVRLEGLIWASNGDGSRFFLAVGARSEPELRQQQDKKEEEDALMRLLHGCNAVAREFKQPTLYASSVTDADDATELQSDATADLATAKQASSRHSARANPFHFSIAWSLDSPHGLGAVDSDGDGGGRTCTAENVSRVALAAAERLAVRVDHVKVKIGNAVTAISLDARAGD